MKSDHEDYSLYKKFIETYTPSGFKEIDPKDPLLIECEEYSKNNNQFFHVADLIQAKIIWASTRSTEMIGIRPEELNAYHFIEATHPDDLEKHTLGRSKMFNLANDLYRAENGRSLLSIDLRIRNYKGEYPNLLFQLYFYYVTVPNRTVFLFQVHTDIDWFKKRKHGYHYNVGNDFSNFRYPDENLLMMGNPFSKREFEIIKLIAEGLSSEEIAEKLFVSLYTVNTHRRNILEKSGEANMPELIFKLMQQRIL